MINAVGKSYAANMPMTPYAQPVGGGNLSTVSKPDEFVSNKKEEKKLSTKAKVGIGAGILAFGGLVAAAVLSKGKTLGNVKLAEKITFKPAKTIEEARAFAKNHLGIKYYDESMPLDVANWANEGLVNVSNAAKGKVKMPGTIAYHSMKDGEALACMSTQRDGGKFGAILNINKSTFENIGKEIKDSIPELYENNIAFKNKNGKLDFFSLYKNEEGSSNLIESLNRFIEKPDSFKLIDKIKLYEDLNVLVSAHNGFYHAPLSQIEALLKNPKIKEIASANSILTDVKSLEKLTTAEQRKILIQLANTCGKSRVPIQLGYAQGNKFNTIYHEMGHLQHEISAGEVLCKRMGKPEECQRDFGKVTEITKDFLGSQEKQQLASRVSAYSEQSPLEFVAEVFSKLCAGKKLPDAVMKLYEYYKGPMLPNM